MTKTYIDELVEEIARLRDYYDKAITREREMATKFNNTYWENQQFKELLKECKNLINECISGDYKDELCERINEVLK